MSKLEIKHELNKNKDYVEVIWLNYMQYDLSKWYDWVTWLWYYNYHSSWMQVLLNLIVDFDSFVKNFLTWWKTKDKNQLNQSIKKLLT